MIRKFYSARKKPGYKWDAKEKKWYSHGFDIRRADGKRIRESGFFSQADAEAAVAKIRLAEKEARYGFINSLTHQPAVKVLFERRLLTIRTRRERVRAERVFSILLDILTPTKKIPDVTTDDLQKYTEKRLRDGLKPQSVGREWNIIAAAFNSARDYFPQMRDWLPPSFPRPKGVKNIRRKRLIRPEEIIKALTWFYEPQKEDETGIQAWNRRTVGHVFQFALLTGARKASLCKVRWADVDFERRVIKIIDTKNLDVNERPEFLVPLTTEAMNILQERRENWPHAYVFTRAGGEVSHYYKIWREASEATGINYGQNVEGGFRPHDARHTAATMFYRQTKDLTVVRAFTGHESNQLFVYLHEDEGTMREAQQAMEDYMKSGT